MKKTYELTKHTIERKDERGFTQKDIEMILGWGTSIKTNRNSTKVFFGAKECYQLKKELENSIQRLDRLEGSTLIVSEHDCVIITLYNNHDESDELKASHGYEHKDKK